jgi:hypothetical protein
MPFDGWLKSLPDDTVRHVQTDLDVLNSRPFLFLGNGQAAYQIERLSAHLGSKPPHIRQAAISYSLYVRQLDAIQEKESAIHRICAHDCHRPPVGCCNSEHHIILSLSDFLIARPTQNSLHLAHVLTALQKLEHAHALKQGRLPRPCYCSHLTVSGCTLRLFKSPRCIHYLCPQVEEEITATYGKNGAAFLSAMHDTGNRVILSLKDFTSPEVIRAAELLFIKEDSVDRHETPP